MSAIMMIVAVGGLAGGLAMLIPDRGPRSWANVGLGMVGALLGSVLFGIVGFNGASLESRAGKALAGAAIILAVSHGLGVLTFRRRRG